MFEKFTEKATNVVIESQKVAKALKAPCIMPEHLLLALAREAKGISLKIFKSYNITPDDIEREIKKSIPVSSQTNLTFSDDYKELLKNTLDLANKSGNPTILYEHLFLAVINDKKSHSVKILENLGFDIYKSRTLLEKLVQKKTKKLSSFKKFSKKKEYASRIMSGNL